MTKIDIFSGFLGAGKTTLIKKLIKEAYAGEKLVLIENEFGEIGIDGGFMKEAGIEVNEMNSGCICCSLVGDFAEALQKVIDEYHPDRVLIEPSGVGKLSDVIAAVQNAKTQGAVVNSFTTVADAGKCKMYIKNFGEFYNNQIEHASTIILSRTQGIKEEKLDAAMALLREHNPEAVIITTPWDAIDGKQILAAMEKQSTLEAEMAALKEEAEHHHEHCECGCHEHEHHHHHEHDEHCECGCHEHEHHHHHHHADEVFTSWGKETHKKFTLAQIESCLKALDDAETCGIVLRAKGIVAGEDGNWIHFDYVPEEINVRIGAADVTGRLCVIGSKLNEAAIEALFGLAK